MFINSSNEVSFISGSIGSYETEYIETEMHCNCNRSRYNHGYYNNYHCRPIITRQSLVKESRTYRPDRIWLIME